MSEESDLDELEENDCDWIEITLPSWRHFKFLAGRNASLNLGRSFGRFELARAGATN